MRLAQLAFVLAVACAACGSSSGTTSDQGSGSSGASGGGDTPPPADDRASREAMTLANALRDEYTGLRNEHERLWQERIRIATGADLEAIGPRYASASADFTARSDQAWQTMNTAVGHVRQGELDGFRHFINQSRGHVAVMRQMVESIQGELQQMSPVEAPPAQAPEPAP